MEPEIEEVMAISDVAERVRQAHAMVGRHQSLSNEAARIRREGIDELTQGGMTQTALGEMLGLSRSRISRLISTAPQVERALLGTGPMTIAIGGKYEAGKKRPGVVVSEPASKAGALLIGMCNEYGLGVASSFGTYEVVPPPGTVRVNRDDLIVLGSPRILPLLEQIMGSDDHYRFEHNKRGRWHLVSIADDVEHLSPADSGDPVDYAYIGRLPRPDGHGTFLYLAGIHAEGTLGAATFLSQNIIELYREVKTRRWSTLISCHYDPLTRDVVSTERIAPIRSTRA